MEGRNILICCDGTASEFEHNTNVVRLYSLTKEYREKYCSYDPGVGTSPGAGTGEQQSSFLGRWRKKLVKLVSTPFRAYGAATGTGLKKNVEDAYRHLMKHYQEGDRLYLFGFSRGAFTVRALAGMLCKVGLLRADLEDKLSQAIDYYKASNNDEIADNFKKSFSRSCTPHFIGVWDTVKSLYLHSAIKFHDNILHPDIRFGCHALSIDDKREHLWPYLWDEETPRNGQTIEQVWFPGVHSDVGGWYKDRRLANGALHWMARRAMAHGLSLDLDKLKHAYQADPLGKIHESHKSFPWFLPFLGKRERTIPPGSKVHHSAIKRMNDPASNYKPTNFPEEYTEVTDD